MQSSPKLDSLLICRGSRVFVTRGLEALELGANDRSPLVNAKRREVILAALCLRYKRLFTRAFCVGVFRTIKSHNVSRCICTHEVRYFRPCAHDDTNDRYFPDEVCRSRNSESLIKRIAPSSSSATTANRLSTVFGSLALERPWESKLAQFSSLKLTLVDFGS